MRLDEIPEPLGKCNGFLSAAVWYHWDEFVPAMPTGMSPTCARGPKEPHEVRKHCLINNCLGVFGIESLEVVDVDKQERYRQSVLSTILHRQSEFALALPETQQNFKLLLAFFSRGIKGLARLSRSLLHRSQNVLASEGSRGLKPTVWGRRQQPSLNKFLAANRAGRLREPEP